MNKGDNKGMMIRLFDIFFSGIAIIVLLPFMIPIMILLKLTGEHDIFFGQTRVGRYGKDFKVLKFATMLRNSINMPGGVCTLENDPRILPMGKFLRKTKINELPQLINIFIGQMSVIGYRPLVRSGYDSYPEETKKVLYNAKPGLSGLGSIAFRNEEEILKRIEDKEKFYKTVIMPYKAKLEEYYIEHKSLGLYFKLVFMTVEAVLRPNSKNWKTKLKGLPKVPKELEQYI
jgi:lipopolysaccharide/colanic/teichoic acid biosynthesis glycosyltransferase